MTSSGWLAALAVMLLAVPARAEDAPPIVPTPPSALPAPGSVERIISYDYTRSQALLGGGPLSPDRLYLALGRPDLVEQSRLAARRRVIFAATAPVPVVIGAVIAAVAWSRLPDLNQGMCVASHHNYNDICVPEYKLRDGLGAGALVTGLALGSILGTLAYWSSPDILSKKETRRLITEHNDALRQRIRERSGSAGAALRLVPQVSAQGGGLSTVLTF
jgi:hypothetical protein